MKARPSRRALAAALLVAAALVGAVVRLAAPPDSAAYYVGTLCMVLWVPIAGNVIAYGIRKRREQRRAPPAPGFVTPFAAQLAVELTLHDNPRSVHAARLPPGEFHCLFALGTEAFSARIWLPDGLRAREPADVEAEFLAAGAALPRFGADTAFRMLSGGAVIGSGRVLPASRHPGAGRDPDVGAPRFRPAPE